MLVLLLYLFLLLYWFLHSATKTNRKTEVRKKDTNEKTISKYQVRLEELANNHKRR